MTRRTIDDLLSERHDRFTPLQQLLRRSQRQKDWTKELRAVLPQSLARQCSVAEVRGTTIHVLCRNAPAATRLRFMSPTVITQLAALNHFANVQRINIRVSG